MTTLASLNRKARKLAGLKMAEARKAARRAEAQRVVDACAADARCTALRTMLCADKRAAEWLIWATERLDEAQRAAALALDAAHEEAVFLGLDVTDEGLADEKAEAHQRVNGRHARFLLEVAYGADVARREVLDDYAAQAEERASQTADEPTEAKMLARERRAAVKAAVNACMAHLYLTEPTGCEEVTRGAVAMLALLTSPDLLSCLPKSPRIGLMLPDALRIANRLLPVAAQASAPA